VGVFLRRKQTNNKKTNKKTTNNKKQEKNKSQLGSSAQSSPCRCILKKKANKQLRKLRKSKQKIRSKQTNKQTRTKVMAMVNLGRSAEACHPSTAKQSNMAERWSAVALEDKSACGGW
jgi:hypothetical protein